MQLSKLFHVDKKGNNESSIFHIDSFSSLRNKLIEEDSSAHEISGDRKNKPTNDVDVITAMKNQLPYYIFARKVIASS